EVASGFELDPSTSISTIGLSILLTNAVGAAARLACTRGDRFAAWLSSLCFVASVIALAATTQIRDRIVDHEVFWISALGALNVGVAAAAFAAAAASAGLSSVNRPRVRGAGVNATI